MLILEEHFRRPSEAFASELYTVYIKLFCKSQVSLESSLDSRQTSPS